MTKNVMKRILFCAAALIVLAGFIPCAHALTLTYAAILDGPSSSPPNASPGTGVATVEYDDVLHSLFVDVSFSGLSGITTAAHIHGPTALAGTGTAGVATQTPSFLGFPLGVTGGSYQHTFDLTLPASFNLSFFNTHGGTSAGAEAALGTMLASGTAYFNIHTNHYPGGEIRGFLRPASVPEPSILFLLGLGCAGLAGLGRRTKRLSK